MIVSFFLVHFTFLTQFLALRKLHFSSLTSELHPSRFPLNSCVFMQEFLQFDVNALQNTRQIEMLKAGKRQIESVKRQDVNRAIIALGFFLQFKGFELYW